MQIVGEKPDLEKGLDAFNFFSLRTSSTLGISSPWLAGMPKVARAVLPPPRAPTTTQDGTTTSNGLGLSGEAAQLCVACTDSWPNKGQIPRAGASVMKHSTEHGHRTVESIRSHDLPTAYGYGMIWLSPISPRHVKYWRWRGTWWHEISQCWTKPWTILGCGFVLNLLTFSEDLSFFIAIPCPWLGVLRSYGYPGLCIPQTKQIWLPVWGWTWNNHEARYLSLVGAFPTKFGCFHPTRHTHTHTHTHI